MKETKVILNRDFQTGKTDPLMFGAFVEQFGRVVYGGVYEPGKFADDMGFRRDVMELVRELDITGIRYPGGNMVSAYHWENGVGPVDERPATFDPAWKAIDSNRVGIGEFQEYCKRLGTQMMMAVNLSTGTLDEAKNLIEYCNFQGGTKYSDLRAKHGSPEPFGVRYWFLGNEMDGHWQIGRTTAGEYAWRAKEASKIMRRVDPTAKFILCGSSLPDYSSYPTWDREVLEMTYEDAEYLSLHSYYRNEDADSLSFLASDTMFDNYIRGKIATCDYVKAKRRSKRTMMLSFDEYNVSNSCPYRYEARGRKMPVLEGNYGTIYNVEDAIALGGLLLSLLRHADRVKIACIAQMVNAIAPIVCTPEKPAWRQTTFYPFLHFSKYGRGAVLQTLVDSPLYECKLYGEVPTVRSIGVLNDDGAVTVFAINRSLTDPAPLTVELQGIDVNEVTTELEFGNRDPLDCNDADHPDEVVPKACRKAVLEDGVLKTELAPLSWNVIRLAKKH